MISVFCALTGGYKIQPNCRFSAQPIDLRGLDFAALFFGGGCGQEVGMYPLQDGVNV